ncbi:hypothetical protein SASPL_127034 [Salvia splendens]|uniref:Uncharacterized protein n=1 Tax=Salvia splendens TaxID=180675 RepID=A0A8X8XGS1_SALSN|nr:hypothetical protein SASPL_127034 [Salvia splendens]
MNLETTGNVNADTSHVPDNDAAKNTPDKTKGSKRMKESVLQIHNPEADQQAEIQPAEESRKGAASKKFAKVKLNKGKEKVREGVEKGETDEENVRHEALKLKTSPRKIVELFQSLNEEQLNEVVDMGFGALQHFGIAEVPGKLAYAMVKRFNDCRTHIDHLFRDISVVKEYNRCAYVLETLAVAVKSWRSSKHTPFTGPISFLLAFYVDRVFHQKMLVSRVFPTVFGWTSEKLRLREKMEIESSHTFGRGSVLERGDPDKLPRPSSILVFEETETTEKDQWEVAIEGFATASEDAARGLQNLMLSMTDLKNMIQNFEAMKIAGSTACNMIGVIPETTVDEKETVTSMEAALAKDKFNSPELVEVVKNMIKVTTQLTKIADEGPPFNIHPSFEQQNISSFTAVGMIQSSNTEKSFISVGSEEARLCASKSDTQEHNNMIGTSFNGSSVASKQKGKEQELAINVEEIVKSAMADYMDGGGDVAADEFCSEASATKTTPRSDNQLRINDDTNGEELDVEAIVKSAVEAYMECDEDDADFVTPFTNKSEPKVGEALLYTVVMSNGQDDDADKLDKFASNIDKEVSEIPHFAWGDIDMVFFAFCVSKRYYTVCFCFKQKSVVIIDACKDGEDNDLRFTYGSIPEALV